MLGALWKAQACATAACAAARVTLGAWNTGSRLHFSSSSDGDGPSTSGASPDWAAFNERLSEVETSGSTWSAPVRQDGSSHAAAASTGSSEGSTSTERPTGDQEGPPGAAGTSAAGAAAAATSGSPTSCPHPQYGYAVLGGINPEEQDTQEAAGAEQPRLHPRREFQPGQTYEPKDLNAYDDDEDALLLLKPTKTYSGPPLPRRLSAADRREWEAQVKANLDYKNVSFLMEFVTASGRLKGRKHTQLNPLLHSRAARAVKLARSMALMPYEMQSGDEPADGGASSMRLRQFAAAQAAQQQQQRQGSDKRGRRGPREQAERAAPAGA